MAIMRVTCICAILATVFVGALACDTENALKNDAADAARDAAVSKFMPAEVRGNFKVFGPVVKLGGDFKRQAELCKLATFPVNTHQALGAPNAGNMQEVYTAVMTKDTWMYRSFANTPQTAPKGRPCVGRKDGDSFKMSPRPGVSGGWWSFRKPTSMTKACYRAKVAICPTFNDLSFVRACKLKAGTVITFGKTQSMDCTNLNAEALKDATCSASPFKDIVAAANNQKYAESDEHQIVFNAFAESENQFVVAGSCTEGIAWPEAETTTCNPSAKPDSDPLSKHTNFRAVRHATASLINSILRGNARRSH